MRIRGVLKEANSALTCYWNLHRLAREGALQWVGPTPTLRNAILGWFHRGWNFITER